MHRQVNSIEVDMVPLIDIISLLLMFLIIVGDMKGTEGNVDMKLPRADQAIDIRQEGRIVVQLQSQEGTYRAVIANKSYELVSGATNLSLKEHLESAIRWALEKGAASRDSLGNVSIPVKLRIPEGAPMREAERLMMAMAEVGLTNIQYAAAPTLH